jgi:hypothetical protein
MLTSDIRPLQPKKVRFSVATKKIRMEQDDENILLNSPNAQFSISDIFVTLKEVQLLLKQAESLDETGTITTIISTSFRKESFR